jgi:hypothetical protein
MIFTKIQMDPTKKTLFNKLATYETAEEMHDINMVVYGDCVMKSSLGELFKVGDRFAQVSIAFDRKKRNSF